MATSKPDLTTNGIWGSDNINITDPGATKTKEGWGSEIPPSGVQNWWQERADEMLNHLNEQGIAVWDSLTDYPVNGWVKGSDGEVYISLQTPNLNQDPTSTPAYWLSLSSMLLANTSQGRLVKFLTTSGTLTINDSADDKDPAYLTSTEIKSGNYLVFAHGAGGGGASGDAAGNTTSGITSGGAGGGAGGIGYGVLSLTVNTPYTIGAGGAGGLGAAGGNDGADGGDTTISTVTGGGGGGGGSGGVAGGEGGTGNWHKGAGGGGGAVFRQSGTTGLTGVGGKGGGPSGGIGGRSGSGSFVDGGLASGGGGSDTSAFAGGDGGDGYIEIYEWS